MSNNLLDLTKLQDEEDTVTPILDLNKLDNVEDKYSSYENPALVKQLDEFSPVLKKVGDFGNALFVEGPKEFHKFAKSEGEAFVNADEDTKALNLDEGTKTAIGYGQAVAKTGIRAVKETTAAASTFLGNVGALSADLTVRGLDLLPEEEKAKVAPVREFLKTRQRELEFGASVVSGWMEDAYKGIDYIQASDPQYQDTLNTAGALATVVSAGIATAPSKASKVNATKEMLIRKGLLTETAPTIAEKVVSKVSDAAKLSTGTFLVGSETTDDLGTFTGKEGATGPFETMLRPALEEAAITLGGGAVLAGAKAIGRGVDKALGPVVDKAGNLITKGSEEVVDYLLHLPTRLQQTVNEAVSRGTKDTGDEVLSAAVEADIIRKYGDLDLDPAIKDKVDTGFITPERSAVNDPKAQGRIRKYLGKTFDPELGLGRQTFVGAFVDKLRPLEDIFREAYGITTRQLSGDFSTLKLLSENGSQMQFSGFISGKAPDSKFVSVLDRGGVLREVEGVKNLSSLMSDVGKTMLDSKLAKDMPEAINKSKEYLKALDFKDTYINMSRAIDELTDDIASGKGINKKVEAGQPIEKEVLDLWALSEGKADLNDKAVYSKYVETFGTAYKDLLDQIKEIQSRTLEWDRAKTDEVLNSHNGYEWANELREGYSRWNTALLDFMVESGTISRETMDKWVKSNPHHIPQYKIIIDEGLQSSRKKTSATVKPFTSREGSDIANKDVVDSLIEYTRRVVGQSVLNRQNNLTIETLANTLDNESWNMIFVNDKQKVLEAINKAKELGGNVVDTKDTIVNKVSPRAGAVDGKVITNFTKSIDLGVNGARIGLTFRNADMFALMSNLNMVNGKLEGAAKLWANTNRLLSNVYIRLRPSVAPLVSIKEAMDSPFFSYLPAGKSFHTSRRTAYLADIAGSMITNKASVFEGGRTYQVHSGIPANTSSLDWFDDVDFPGQVLERHIAKGNKGKHVGKLVSGVEWLNDLVQQYQSGWDRLVRAPEYEALLKAGVDERDALVWARTGSTPFAQFGATVDREYAEQWYKKKYDPSKILMNTTTHTLATKMALWRAASGAVDTYYRALKYDSYKTLSWMTTASMLYGAAEIASNTPEEYLEYLSSPTRDNTNKLDLINDFTFATGFVGTQAKAMANTGSRIAAYMGWALTPKNAKEALREDNPDLVKQLEAIDEDGIWYVFFDDALNALGVTLGGPGLGVISSGVNLVQGEDTKGNPVLTYEDQQQPLDVDKVGRNTKPVYIELARKIYQKTGGDVDVSPAYLQNAAKLIGGYVEDVISGVVQGQLQSNGMINPMPEVDPYRNNTNLVTAIRNAFIKKDPVAFDRQNVMRSFSAMNKISRNIADELEARQLAHEENDPSRPPVDTVEEFEAWKIQNQDFILAEEVFGPARAEIKELYKERTALIRGPSPDPNEKIGAGLGAGSKEKRLRIEQIDSIIYRIQKDTLDKYKSMSPSTLSSVQGAVLEQEHPIFGAASKTAAKALAKVTSFVGDFFTDEQQVVTPHKTSVDFIPFEELQPRLDMKSLDAVEQRSGVSKGAILDKVYNAAQVTNTDPSLLVSIIGHESKFATIKDTYKITKEKSASGIAQFQTGTWNAMVEKYGDEFGIGKADKHDDQAQLIMTGLLIQENYAAHTRIFGEAPTSNMLYVYHLLGQNMGAEFINELKGGNPYQLVTDVLPNDVVNNNPSIFKDPETKNVRTIAEAYNAVKSNMGKAKALAKEKLGYQGD